MKKILEVNVDDQGLGGVYSLVRSVILGKPEGYQMDIACIMHFADNAHIKELNDRGTQVYFIGREGHNHVSMRDLEQNLYQLLMKNQYDCVHIHADTAYRMYAFGHAAKRAGVRKIIFHSHAAGVDGNYLIVKKFLHRVYRGRLKKIGYCFAACSDLAAAWMYPGIPREKVIQINNGIDLNRFRFDADTRREMREELGLSDYFVVGHVGRFSYQKNHEYLIRVFQAFKKEVPKAKLLLIGSHDGTKEIWDRIREMTAQAGLSEDVIFYGTTDHVERMMQAMDLFVLPSRFEGLPVVGVEAQACGLPVVYSDRITREAALTDRVSFAGIEEKDIDAWVRAMKDQMNLERTDMVPFLRKEGFDINDTIQSFLNLYKDV